MARPQEASSPVAPPPAALASPPASAASAPSAMSAEQVKQRVEATIQEYFDLADIDEAVLCIREISSGDPARVAVRYCANTALECSDKQRRLIERLLKNFLCGSPMEKTALKISFHHWLILPPSPCRRIDPMLLPPHVFCEEIGMVAEFLEDILIDVPYAVQHFAMLLSLGIQMGKD
jgi:hypothetical protein